MGLIGAYLASYINPNSFVIPSLLGLAYPYLLIITFLLLLYWLAQWKLQALIVLVVILAGIPAFKTYYGTNRETQSAKESDLSIMSYNIRFFDMYEWSKDKKTKEKLYDYLNDYKGDVLCLQEYPGNDAVLSGQYVAKRLSTYKYRYIYKDMAIFSRLPIQQKGNIKFAAKYTSSCIYCDIAVGKNKIRVYNVHLESYKLGHKERRTIKQITDGLKGDDITEGVWSITKRLVSANKNRAVQAKQIKKHIASAPHSVIVAGDFNDTPLSYTYRELKSDLKDSFTEKGHGLGNTYIGEFPSFRIDYILHSPTFETVSYLRGRSKLSDHYPISCRLKIK